MKKQTAVEYLLEQMGLEQLIFLKEIIDKAKEMEKQQVIDFADDYGTYLLKGGIMNATTYKEKFKSE
jgi:hypothetical protein